MILTSLRDSLVYDLTARWKRSLRNRANGKVIRRRCTNLSLDSHNDFPCYNWNGIGLESGCLDKVEERYLLLGGGNGSVILHDVENPMKPVAKRKRCKRKQSGVEGHRKFVTSVDWFGSDNGIFVTGSRDRHVLVWDSNEFLPVSSFALGDAVNAVRLTKRANSPIAGLVACGTTDAAIRLCDMSSGSRAHQLTGHKASVNGLAWSPSHEYVLVSASSDKTVRLWDVRRSGTTACIDSLSYFEHGGATSTSRNALAHDGEVMSVEFACGGLYLVSSGKDKRIRVWKYAVDRTNGPLYRNTLVNISMDLSSKSSCTAIASNAGVKETLVYHPKSIQGDTCFSSFCIHTGRELQTLTGGHFRTISAIVYRASTQQVYSIGKDGLIVLWSYSAATEQEGDKAVDQDSWSD